MDKKETKKMMQILTGVVASTKNAKTVIVSVTNMTRHPLYKKAVKMSKRYAVHCELEGVAVGDRVKIEATKPVSKTKFFKVLEKLTK